MTRPRAAPIRLAAAVVAGALATSAAALAQPTALPPDTIAAAERPAPYPSFADVPQVPKDVRPPEDWKGAVVATRRAGARLARLVEREPWALSDTEAFAERARSDAQPPAPVTTSSQAETEALVKAMKARAMKPPRSR